MDHDLRAHSFRATSVALIVALAGCATHPPDRVISDVTRNKLVQALQDSGDTANAAVLRDQIEKKAPAPAPASDALTHATALIAAGQVDQGISDAKAALAARGDDTAFALEVGRLAIRSGRLADAADVYRQVLLQHPDSVEALNGSGVVLAQQGNASGAADAFRKALTLHPRDVPTLNNLALLMVLEGSPNAALALLKNADHMDETPQIKNLLAVARERSGMRDAPRPAPLAQVKSQPLPLVAAAPAAIANPALTTDSAAPVATTPASAPVTPAGPVGVSAGASVDAAPEQAPKPKDPRIVVRARAEAWLQVHDAAGQILLERNLQPGETWAVPRKAGLTLSTGNAGGTELIVDGVVSAPLGGLSVVRRDIPLAPDLIRSGKVRATRVFASLNPG